ncbi:helix-turn-helix domain-containing protein [Microbacterium sp. 16-032]|uniref:helix-turn-helix domain-containing protein n=1 Tax=Microbacterium sp. 16-032 TaxID=3239808 RepID=UPI0034E1BBDD
MSSSPVPTEYVTISQAASALSLSTKTIRRLIQRGDLAAERIGARTIRIPVAALAAVGRPMQVPRSR